MGPTGYNGKLSWGLLNEHSSWYLSSNPPPKFQKDWNWGPILWASGGDVPVLHVSNGGKNAFSVHCDLRQKSLHHLLKFCVPISCSAAQRELWLLGRTCIPLMFHVTFMHTRAIRDVEIAAAKISMGKALSCLGMCVNCDTLIVTIYIINMCSVDRLLLLWEATFLLISYKHPHANILQHFPQMHMWSHRIPSPHVEVTA